MFGRHLYNNICVVIQAALHEYGNYSSTKNDYFMIAHIFFISLSAFVTNLIWTTKNVAKNETIQYWVHSKWSSPLLITFTVLFPFFVYNKHEVFDPEYNLFLIHVENWKSACKKLEHCMQNEYENQALCDPRLANTLVTRNYGTCSKNYIEHIIRWHFYFDPHKKSNNRRTIEKKMKINVQNRRNSYLVYPPLSNKN